MNIQSRAVEILFIGLFVFSIIYVTAPYIKSKISPYSELGFRTVINEESQNTALHLSTQPLTHGKVITKTFSASEDNLGIVLVRFNTFERINTDQVTFRIKETDSSAWQYQHTVNTNQFQDNTYFTFGFPPIPKSKGKSYTIELTSLHGTPHNAVAISSQTTQFATAYRLDITQAPLRFVLYKLRYTLDNITPGSYFMLGVIFLAFLLYWLRGRLFLGWAIITTTTVLRLPVIYRAFKRITAAVKSILFTNTVERRRTQTRGIMLIAALLFVLALWLRYTTYLDFLPDRPPLYTTTLGSGSDPEGEIMCAIGVATNPNWPSWCSWSIIDYMFLAPCMSVNGAGKTGQGGGVKPGQPTVTSRLACLGLLSGLPGGIRPGIRAGI